MSTRELLLSQGSQVRPTKTAKVKREFTFMMPSRAVMWMLVVIFSDGGGVFDGVYGGGIGIGIGSDRVADFTFRQIKLELMKITKLSSF